MNRLIITLSILLISLTSFSQDPFKELKSKKNFIPVLNIGMFPGMEKSVSPQYIDGKEGLDKFLENNVISKGLEEKGTVIIMYTISKYGKLTNAQVTSQTSKLLNDRVIDALKKSGPWIPATKGNKYVSMKMTVSYDFK